MGRNAELSSVGYFYLWRFLEIISILFFGRFLSRSDFAIAFIPILTVSFFASFLGLVKLDFKKEDKLKRMCSTFSLFSLVTGVVIAFIMQMIPASGQLNFSFMVSSAILIVISLKMMPEVFYLKTSPKKVYRAYSNAYLVALPISAILVFFKYGHYAVLLAYFIIQLITAYSLWKNFPIKISFRPYKEEVREIFSQFVNSALKIDFIYVVLILSGILIGFREFSFLFMSYVIAYFLYKSITLFLTSYLREKFLEMGYDVFKYNLIRIIEYVALLSVPFALILAVLSNEFIAYFLTWRNFSEILVVFLFAGLIKTITEVTRLAFFVELRTDIMNNIRYIESTILIVLSLLLLENFGIYGIALAVLVSSVVSSLLYLGSAEKLTRLDILAVSRDYVYIFFSGIATALILGLLKEWFAITNVFSLIFFILMGIAVYVALTYLFNTELYRRFVQFSFNLVEEK